jgi:hypothetical protein
MRFTNTAAALTVATMLAVPALAQTTTPSATTGQGTSGLQQNVPGATPQADLGTGAGVPRAAATRTKEQRRAAQAERRDRRPTDTRDRAYQDGGTLGGIPGGPTTTTGIATGTTGQGTSGLRN